MADLRTITLPNGQTYSLRDDGILFNTTAYWNSQTTLVSQEGYIYIYTDHQTKDGDDIPGIKVGDGNAYVVDLPFMDDVYAAHIADSVIHVTQADKTSWNNKVTCYIDPNKADKLVFSKE